MFTGSATFILWHIVLYALTYGIYMQWIPTYIYIYIYRRQLFAHFAYFINCPRSIISGEIISKKHKTSIKWLQHSMKQRVAKMYSFAIAIGTYHKYMRKYVWICVNNKNLYATIICILSGVFMSTLTCGKSWGCPPAYLDLCAYLNICTYLYINFLYKNIALHVLRWRLWCACILAKFPVVVAWSVYYYLLPSS